MMNENLLFRKAATHEADSIKEIAKRVIRHNYVPFLGAEATKGFIDSGMSDIEIDNGLDRCTVMLSGDSIIGFAITDNDLLHLIMVDVPFQGKGYGGKLLEPLESKLFSHYETIRLQTFKENANSIEFYQKHGWLVSGEEIVPEMNKTMLFLEKSSEGEVNVNQM